MCIAILKLPNGTISEDRLASCWHRNNDGGGFAYNKGGEVVVDKGYMDLASFMAAYKKALSENAESKFLVHFRIATAGKVSPDNTHPFKMRTGALIHNGHFFYAGDSAEKSDTRIVAEALDADLATKSDWFIAKESVQKAITYNKVAVLFNDGDHLIFNESSGAWDDSVWYSNTYSFSSAAPARQRSSHAGYWGGYPYGIGEHADD